MALKPLIQKAQNRCSWKALQNFFQSVKLFSDVKLHDHGHRQPCVMSQAQKRFHENRSQDGSLFSEEMPITSKMSTSGPLLESLSHGNLDSRHGWNRANGPMFNM